MRHSLPDWNRVCRKIVDGESERVKCREVLEDELGPHFRQMLAEGDEGGYEEPSWFERLVQGDPSAVAWLVVPAAAVIWYRYFYDKGVPQQVTTTG